MLTRVQILAAPGKQPEARQQSCLLLDLPPELLRKIIRSKELSVFDKGCLMLTCKSFARYVATFGGRLCLMQEIQSGREEELVEMWSEMGMFEDEEDETYWDELASRESNLRNRVTLESVTDFFRRLDLGWNTSQSRLCSSCDRFRSTSQGYWDQKVQAYLYTLSGKAGQGWRYLRDCECGHEPKSVIEKWVKHGVRKDGELEEKTRRYVVCPDCEVSATCCCSCYYGDGCGCPCPLCHQDH